MYSILNEIFYHNAKQNLALNPDVPLEAAPVELSPFTTKENAHAAPTSSTISNSSSNASYRTPVITSSGIAPKPVQAAPSSKVPPKGLLICKHCKLSVTTNRDKLAIHEKQCTAAKSIPVDEGSMSQSSTLSSASSMKRKKQSAKQSLPSTPNTRADTNNTDERPYKKGTKAVWRVGSVRALEGDSHVLVQLNSKGREISTYPLSDVRPRRSIGWAWVVEPTEGSQGDQEGSQTYVETLPTTTFAVGQQVEVRVFLPDKLVESEESAASPAGGATGITPTPTSRNKKNTVHDAKQGAQSSKKKNAAPPHTVATNISTGPENKVAQKTRTAPNVKHTTVPTERSTSASSSSKVKRIVAGRNVGEPAMGALPTVRHLQAYVSTHRSVHSPHMKALAAMQNELLDRYEEELFLDWLTRLQFHSNILCYGVGCKQKLLRRFTSKMLVDEDVIEINFTCGRNASLFESVRGEADRDGMTPSTGDTKLTSSTSTSRNQHVSLLWDLLHLIRVHVLAQPQHQVSAYPWYCPNGDAPSPVEHEARLVAGNAKRGVLQACVLLLISRHISIQPFSSSFFPAHPVYYDRPHLCLYAIVSISAL